MSPSSRAGNESESSNELFAVTWFNVSEKFYVSFKDTLWAVFGNGIFYKQFSGVFRNNLLRFASRMIGNITDGLGWLDF